MNKEITEIPRNMTNKQLKVKKNAVVPPSGDKLRLNINKIFTELIFKMKEQGLSEKIIKIVTDNKVETLSEFLSDHEGLKVTSKGILDEIGEIVQPKIIANYIHKKLFGDLKVNR